MQSEEKITAILKIGFFQFQIVRLRDEYNRNFSDYMSDVIDGSHAIKMKEYILKEEGLIRKIIEQKRLLNEPFIGEVVRLQELKTYTPASIKSILETAKKKTQENKKPEQPVGFFDNTSFSDN